jgi:hypothetical protein
MNYTINTLKNGISIKEYISRHREFLDKFKNILVEPIGINLGLIDELKNQGYEVNGGK